MPLSYLRGHSINFIDGEWVYADTLEPTVSNPRPCGRCGKDRTPEGYDACLGHIPGIINACCGHGDDKEVYFILEGGTRVSL